MCQAPRRLCAGRACNPQEVRKRESNHTQVPTGWTTAREGAAHLAGLALPAARESSGRASRSAPAVRRGERLALPFRGAQRGRGAVCGGVASTRTRPHGVLCVTGRHMVPVYAYTYMHTYMHCMRARNWLGWPGLLAAAARKASALYTRDTGGRPHGPRTPALDHLGSLLSVLLLRVHRLGARCPCSRRLLEDLHRHK